MKQYLAFMRILFGVFRKLRAVGMGLPLVSIDLGEHIPALQVAHRAERPILNPMTAIFLGRSLFLAAAFRL